MDAAASGLSLKEVTEELDASMLIQFGGRNLDIKDKFGKSDPFLVFKKSDASGKYTEFARTEVIKKNLDPSWRAQEFCMGEWCHGHEDLKVLIECWDWDRVGSNDFIGACELSLLDIRAAAGGETQWPLVNPKLLGKQAKKVQKKGGGAKVEGTYVDSGKLMLIRFTEVD